MGIEFELWPVETVQRYVRAFKAMDSPSSPLTTEQVRTLRIMIETVDLPGRSDSELDAFLRTALDAAAVAVANPHDSPSESTDDRADHLNGAVVGTAGEQARSSLVLDAPPSFSKAQRKSPEQMAAISEDLIKLIDHLANSYRRGHHPDSKAAEKVAEMLRAVADVLQF